MKKLNTYKTFINESLRDKMTPVPMEEVKRLISEKPEIHLKRYKEYLSNEEIYDIVDKMKKGEQIKAILFDVPELYSNDNKKELISALSRDVQHDFILGRFRDLYTKEEIEDCWKDIVLYTFEKAYKNGKQEVNLDWLSSKWTKYSEPFKMNDETYLYKGKKMEIESVASGDWYIHFLTVIDK